MFHTATGRTCAHPSVLKKPQDGRCCASGYLEAWELAWDMRAEHVFRFDLIQIQELDLAVLHPQELSSQRGNTSVVWYNTFFFFFFF